MRYARRQQPPPGAPSPFRFAQPGSLSTALQAAGFGHVEEAAHTIPWAWPGTPEEAWTAMGEAQAALFRQFRAALDATTQARATAEALAALRAHYDGHEVNMRAGHRRRRGRIASRAPLERGDKGRDHCCPLGAGVSACCSVG